MITAIIFDVDGTLVDSVDLHADAWRVAFGRFGKNVSFEEVRRQIGKGGDQLLPVSCPNRIRRSSVANSSGIAATFLNEITCRA
jgi:beta-phosphoglucomutase-like phosphatase (HAD superfamily)